MSPADPNFSKSGAWMCGVSRQKKFFAACAVLGLSAALFLRSQIEIPILMYHHVGENMERSSTTVSTGTFESQLAFLKVHGYRVMALGDIIHRLKEHQSVPEKAVAITFDDGSLDNIQNAFPLLKEMNFPATIFMITDNIGKPGWLSEEDLRVLDEGGVSIGSHTVHHTFLPGIAAEGRETVQSELIDSKRTLENILGHPVVLFSYPAGGVTPEIRQAVSDAGYEGAVTTNYFKGRHDPYVLHRVKITDSGGSLFSFWIKVSGWYHLGKKRVQSE